MLTDLTNIPADLTQETSLNGKYLKGIPTAVTNPDVNVGNTDHTHTLDGNHIHPATVPSHTHTGTSGTGASIAAGPLNGFVSPFTHTHGTTTDTQAVAEADNDGNHTHDTISNDLEHRTITFYKKTNTSISMSRKSLPRNMTFFYSKINPIPSDWFNENWLQRKKFQINSGQVPTTQTDFPLEFNGIFSELIGFSSDEIRFAGVDMIQLDYEIVKFDSLTGELIASAKKPTVSDDDIVYIYFDNPAATDEQNKQAVWSDYVSVNHMEPSLLDSTGNHDGTNTDTVDIAGKIGRARDFNGSTSFVDLGNFDLTGNQLTLTAVVKVDNSSEGVIIGKSDSPSHVDPFYKWILFKRNDNKITFRIDTTQIVTVNTIPQNQFVRLDVVYTSTDMRIFIDGVFQVSTPKTSDIESSDQNVRIGARDTPITGGGTEFFDGIIDEVRILNIARSDDWITTEYNNQNDTSTFYTEFPKEDFNVLPAGLLENLNYVDKHFKGDPTPGTEAGVNDHQHDLLDHNHPIDISDHEHSINFNSNGTTSAVGGINETTSMANPHSHPANTAATTGKTSTPVISGNSITHQHDDISHEPAFKTLRLMEVNSVAMSNTGVPKNCIFLWLDLISLLVAGWQVSDGTNNTIDLLDIFPKGSATPDTAGGNNTHTHSNDAVSHGHTGASIGHEHTGSTGSSGAPSAISTNRGTGGVNAASAGHTHSPGTQNVEAAQTITITNDTTNHNHGSISNDPDSKTIAFIERNNL